ncbi:MAG: efflux RND transporter periplasmic adaptor subunit [Rhodospirillaceae bacterium]|nr:efflux RND transporter periplasmic adaptor subunit [Rhodospirillaceae bacterium]
MSGKISIGRLRGSHLLAIVMALASVLWIASGVVTGKSPTKKDVAKASAAQPLTLVRVKTVSAEMREGAVVLYGRTDAIKDAELAAETAGRVVGRSARKGAWVKKGAPLFQLAMDDRMARLKETEAKVDYQEIAFNAAKRLSKKQFQSKVRLAEETAELASAKAELATMRLDIQRTTIRAPIDGFIEILPLGIGDYVKIGDHVATIVNLDPIRVVAQVSERDVTRLKAGASARAVLPDGRTLSGELRYISRAGQSDTRTFRVEVWIANPDGLVPEGLTTELRLPTGRTRAHRVSPAILTLDDNGVIGVKAVDAEHRVVFHPVRILGDTPDGIWLGNLPETLTLITVGQEFVRVGQQVRVLDQEATSQPPAAKPDDVNANKAGAS